MTEEERKTTLLTGSYLGNAMIMANVLKGKYLE
jgi:hypothetical protein